MSEEAVSGADDLMTMQAIKDEFGLTATLIKRLDKDLGGPHKYAHNAHAGYALARGDRSIA